MPWKQGGKMVNEQNREKSTFMHYGTSKTTNISNKFSTVTLIFKAEWRYNSLYSQNQKAVVSS